MTPEKIAELNKKCTSSEQGIYVQPYGIPVNIKEHVIYKRWYKGGYKGGNCWDDTEPYWVEGEDEPNFEILDIVLKELKPNITYIQYKEIENLIHENTTYGDEYYGNSSEDGIKYIILSQLEKYLNKLT
jgi:hypothetical protein